MLSFDGNPESSKERCVQCGKPHDLSQGFVLKNDEPFAFYKGYMYGEHGDPDQPVMFFEVFVSDDWQLPDPELIVFGSAVYSAEQDYQLSLVDPDKSLALPKRTDLSREQALKHPQLADTWQVTDFAMQADPRIHKFLYGHKPKV